MKTTSLHLGALMCAVCFGLPTSIFAQGSLTPSGTPGPTMKSLDQIAPRTPISSLPFTISSGGGYYLTKSLNIASGDAITITVSGVTLDLNGFEITSTEGSPAHSGILINSGLRNIRITNGQIRGNVTLSGSTFSGSGFANGIQTTGTAPVNAHVLDVSVAGCLSNGINLGASGLVEACTVSVIGGTGITADNVIYSNAYNFGSVGIQAGASATGCYVTSSASPFYGISADDLVTGCVASCNASSSQGAIETQVARDCWASANSGAGDGLLANIAENCFGASFGTGSGIHCFNSAINCQGLSSAGAAGVNVTGSALNCYGTNGGSGSNAIGLSALTAQSCTGQSLGTAGGPGIKANEAVGCYGSSVSAGGINSPGVSALSAQSCYGASSATSASIGVHATNASFCFGQIGSNNEANGSFAILSQIAFCCSGSPATNTTGGSTVDGVSIYFSGSGSSPYP
jgi:hypothetical protein